MRRFTTRHFSTFFTSNLTRLKAVVIATALVGPAACDAGADASADPSKEQVEMLMPAPVPDTEPDPNPDPDPEPASTSCYVDADGDGVGSAELDSVVIDEPCPAGTSAMTGDCNDDDPTLKHTVTCYADADGDGVGDDDVAHKVCAASCEAAGAYSTVPDSACPDSASDADVDAWVKESLASKCIVENREFTATSGAVSCQNTGTTAKPKRKETQVWTITLKPEQILMGQATSCYANPLPVVAGKWQAGRLPDDTSVIYQGATANMPQEAYYNVGTSSQLEVVVPFKATLSTATDYTSSDYDNIAKACADDGTWKSATHSAGAPTSTPELITRLYSSTYASDDDDCFYLELTGGVTHPTTKDKVFGIGTAMKSDITKLATVTTDLSMCNLVMDDATTHLPTFSVFIDSTPYFGMSTADFKCGFDEDFAWDADDDQEATYCAEAMKSYTDGLLAAAESKWDSGAAKMQAGLQDLVGGILQLKDISEHSIGSSVWTVSWNSVAYTSAGIVFTVTHTRNDAGKCK